MKTLNQFAKKTVKNSVKPALITLTFFLLSLYSFGHSGIVVLVKSGCNEFYLCVGNYHSIADARDAIKTGNSGVYLDIGRDGFLDSCCNGGSAIGSDFIPFESSFDSKRDTAWQYIGSRQIEELLSYFKSSSQYNPNSNKSFTSQTIWLNAGCHRGLDSWLILKIDSALVPYYKYKARVGDASYVERPCGGASPEFSVEYNPGDVSLSASDSIICPADSILLVAEDTLNIKWYKGTTLINGVSDSLYITDPGSYFYTIDSGCRVKRSNSVFINLDTSGPVSIGKDTVVCNGKEFSLSLKSSFIPISWSSDRFDSTLFVDSTQQIWVVARNINSGCISSDTIQVNFQYVTIDLGPDTFMCSNTPFELKSHNTNYAHMWSTGDTTSAVLVDKEQLVILTVMDSLKCKFSDSILVSIHPIPVPNMLSSSELVQCYDKNEFSFNSNYNKEIKAKNFWYLNNNFINQGLDSIHIENLSVGAYSVKVVTRSEFGCSDSFVKIIEVLPSPQSNIAWIDSNFCFDENYIQLQSQTNNDTLGEQIAWLIGSNKIGQSKNLDFSFTKSGVDTIKLWIHNTYGCSSIDTVSITIHPSPKADIQVSRDHYCLNDEGFQFKSESKIQSGIIAMHNWQFSDGTSDFGDVLPAKQFDQSGFYNVLLRVTSDKGCNSSDSLLVRVDPLPEVSISINPVSQHCLNENKFHLQSSTNISGGLVTEWMWSIDNQVYRSPNVSNVTFLSAGTKPIELQVWSDKGCTQFAHNELEVYTNPEPLFSVEDVCLRQSANFNNLTPTPHGQIIHKYLWDFGDLQSSTKEQPRHMYVQPGHYDVLLQVETDKGCIGISDITIIDVHPLPESQFTSNMTYSWEKISELKFTDNSVGSNGNAWYINRSAVAYNRPEYYYSFQDTGLFLVSLEVINEYGCRDTNTKEIFVFPDPKFEMPNAFTPFSSYGLNDQFKPIGLVVAKHYSLQIYNRWGELIFETKNPTEGWNGQYQGKKCQQGVYAYSVSVVIPGRNRVLKKGTITLLEN